MLKCLIAQPLTANWQCVTFPYSLSVKVPLEARTYQEEEAFLDSIKVHISVGKVRKVSSFPAAGAQVKQMDTADYTTFLDLLMHTPRSSAFSI